ncbi:MAG TPA: acylphosphatase [Flavisolibacter sp.]|nr:acylphosphatase [Flavisolibacter sp.]
MPTVHLTVKGKVQGVFYRATAKKMADQFGVRGWVRNTAEGNVEIVASGDPGALEAFIQWCRIGPAGARVTTVIENPAASQSFSDFIIRR